MVNAVRRWLPGVPLTLIGDTTYSAVELGLACRRRGVRLVAPLWANAALYAEPPGGPRKVGRPRVVGRRLPTPASTRDDPGTAWHAVDLPWPDGSTRRLELATGTALWYQPGRGPLPIRWVLTRDPRARLEGRAYFSTEPSDTAEVVVGQMLRRWPIEVTFEEARAHLGVETQRQWSDLAIERETPCLFGLYSLTALLGRSLRGDGAIPVRSSAWYRKAEATFADVLAEVRRACWGLEKADILDPGPRAGVVEIPRDHFGRLLSALYYAH